MYYTILNNVLFQKILSFTDLKCFKDVLYMFIKKVQKFYVQTLEMISRLVLKEISFISLLKKKSYFPIRGVFEMTDSIIINRRHI